MSRQNDVARAIGVGLLACPGGLAIFGGYSASGGMHGWNEFVIRAPRQAFEGDALLWWGAALTVWILCVASLRAGVVGAVGAVLAMFGAGIGLLMALALVNGNQGDPFWLVVGVTLWALGVAIMSWARIDAVAAKQPGAMPRSF